MESKEIKTLVGYKIFKNGMVFSEKRKKFLQTSLNSKGYLKVNVCNNGIKCTKLIHRLIAECFIPNPLNKRQVNHKNGIKTDNRIENLEWCSNSENQKHAYKTGLKIVTHKQRQAGRNNLSKWRL